MQRVFCGCFQILPSTGDAISLPAVFHHEGKECDDDDDEDEDEEEEEEEEEEDEAAAAAADACYHYICRQHSVEDHR